MYSYISLLAPSTSTRAGAATRAGTAATAAVTTLLLFAAAALCTASAAPLLDELLLTPLKVVTFFRRDGDRLFQETGHVAFAAPVVLVPVLLEKVRPPELLALRALDDDVGALRVVGGVLGALLHAGPSHAVEVAARDRHLRPFDRHGALRRDVRGRGAVGLVKDHINPKSWPGDYDPTNVDLQLCWKKGAQLAATACLFDANEVNFAAIAATGATLLSPFPGQGRPGVKVGLRARAAQ